MGKAYYGSRFSTNMTRTPEGYLVCHNVPLARTGMQQYLEREVGGNGDGLIDVYRNEAEVFRPETLASFEGKPVTDDHPTEFLQPSNALAYAKGVCQNVRRGSGDESDLIVADLIIYDAILIAEIESGKREISAGYYCDYTPFRDGFEQTHIVCNHVAVVHNGRAGERVAIKDEDVVTQKKNGGKYMKKSIWERMFHSYAKDEDTTPEELREAADAINEAEKTDDADCEPIDEKKTSTEDTAALVQQAVKDAIGPVLERLAALEAKDEEPSEVDKLEQELTTDSDGDEEERVSAEPEDIETNDEDDESAPTTAEDRALAISVFKALKPTLAALPAKEQKKATDSLRAVLLNKKTSGDAYKSMLRRKTADSNIDHLGDFGAACRARNPHYKGGK